MTLYFDNAATTRVCPEAARAALSAMTETYGNPSSSHAAGRQAKTVLDASRQSLAEALGVSPVELFFTSGGTEANNWALFSAAAHRGRKGGHVLSTRIEHDSVLNPLKELQKRGFDVELLRPDVHGVVSVDAVLGALREDTVLISIMSVNNDTGALLPVWDMAREVKKKRPDVLFHTDAVQAFLKLPFSLKGQSVDMASFSAHKIHGMKGAGALYVKEPLKLSPLIFGGGQERSLRSGTEPLPQIAAFAAAARAGFTQLDARCTHLRALKERAVQTLSENVPGVRFLGSGVAHILCLSLPDYRGETIMNFLEERGVYVSTGSACKKGRRSHTLEAMGLPANVIDGTIRVSFSFDNTNEQVDLLCKAVQDAQRQLFRVLTKGR